MASVQKASNQAEEGFLADPSVGAQLLFILHSQTTIRPIATSIMNELFITISMVMNPHLDVMKIIPSGGKRKREEPAKLYTLAEIQALAVNDQEKFEQCIKTCRDKSRQDHLTRSPSVYNPYRNHFEVVARENLLIGIAEPRIATPLKEALQNIADQDRSTRDLGYDAAHVMSLEQIRRHIAYTSLKSLR